MEFPGSFTARCYPRSDDQFEQDVARAIQCHGSDLDDVIAVLRAKYPAVRIAVRTALADLEHAEVWYCYRDGAIVTTPGSLGAARLWTPIERETRRALDLLEWSSELLRRSNATWSSVARRSSGKPSG